MRKVSGQVKYTWYQKHTNKHGFSSVFIPKQ